MALLDIILGFFNRHGYLVVFFGVMLENAGLPIPGETILLAAGFWAARGGFSLPVVMVVAASGAIVGDNLGYWFGRKLGRDLILRYGRYVLITKARLARIEGYFRRHGNKTIFFARFISGLRVIGALFAGVTHMRWSAFAFYNASGAIVWSIVISLLGYVFGESWDVLEKWIGRTSLVVAGVLIALVLLFKFVREAAPTSESSSDGDV